MGRKAWFWIGVAMYLVTVAVTTVITGPDVIRGADGLEAGPLLLLGLPFSPVVTVVGAWGTRPFGDAASDWGLLIGLIGGSLVNVFVAWRSMTGRAD